MEEIIASLLPKVLDGTATAFQMAIVFIGLYFLGAKMVRAPAVEMRNEFAAGMKEMSKDIKNTNAQLAKVTEQMMRVEISHEGRMNVFEVGMRDLKSDMGEVKSKVESLMAKT